MRLRAGVLALVFIVGCGGAAAAPTPEPTAAPTSAPAAAKPSVSAVASPSPAAVAKPTSTSAPPAAAKPDTVYVGNTDGIGVYVRKTPVMSDRLRAYPDGTALTIVGDDVDGDGQHWRHVKTPDGLEGYVPATYIVDTPQ